MSDDNSKREPAKVPTPGLRVAGGSSGDEGHLVLTTQELEEKMMTLRSTDEQRQVDITYINWLIETDEKRRASLAKLHAGGQDILVDMGDMTRASLDGIRLDADYESMVEDIIQTVNNIVLQGIPPINALFALSQAFAIVMGYALRANMPFPLAKELVKQVTNHANSAEKMLRIITKQ